MAISSKIRLIQILKILSKSVPGWGGFVLFCSDIHLRSSGAFSTLRECVDLESGETFVVKIIDKSSHVLTKREGGGEVARMKSVSSPNVGRVIEIFETHERLFVVRESLSGGDIFDRIVCDFPDGFSEKSASVLFGKIVRAVIQLRESGIVHGRIRPSNLLFEHEDPDAEIKITDFGMTNVVSRRDRCSGSRQTFVAPEMLLNQSGFMSPPLDVWSLGCILYILLCGFPCFVSEDVPTLFDRIISADVEFPSPFWDSVSAKAKHLVRKLIQQRPEDRYTCEQVLRHPWMTGYAVSSRPNEGMVEQLKAYNMWRHLGGLSPQILDDVKRLFSRRKDSGIQEEEETD